MSAEMDGTEALCQALYGRSAQPQDYLGGSDAKMLHDAAKVVQAARCIHHRHDHDHESDGMVVSAEHVRALREALPEESETDESSISQAEDFFAGCPRPDVPHQAELAGLVKRLAMALKVANPDGELPHQALDYLKRQGLLGSPLRKE